MLDKNPAVINTFKGVNQGSWDPSFAKETQERVEFEYGLDAMNIVFKKEGGFQTRPPLVLKKSFPLDSGSGDGGRVVQHWKIARLGTTSYDNRWLYLSYEAGDNTGRFYDTSVGPGTIIKSIVGCKYASVINIYGRLYISPLSDIGTPLTGSDGYIWIWDGSTFRKAGGAAPAGATLTVTDTAVGGANVTAGLHLCAIAFETDSGFITPVGPPTWIQVTITAGGGRAARFTNVDTGPAGTTKRHLLISKSIPSYDGIQTNWELFFGATINDNVTTTGDVILPDTGLVDSADYLLDEFVNIPACNTISVYASHLMYNGPNTDTRLVYVSKPADPESIDQTEDYIQLFDGIPDDIYNGAELRGLYYIFKETCCYVVQEDLNLPPNEWKPNLVDSGIGISPFGIAQVMANPGGLVLDNLIVGGMYGIYIFTGSFQHVQLSLAMQAVFDNLSRSDAKKLRMHVDPIRRRLYMLIGAYPSSQLWMGDYFVGLDPSSIKWTRWVPYGENEGPYAENATSIFVDPNNGGSTRPNITIVSGINSTLLAEPDETNILGQDTFDGNADIQWLVETGFTPNDDGAVYATGRVAIRGQFLQTDATLTIDRIPFDSTTPVDPPISLVMDLLPKAYYSIPFDIDSEHMRIKLTGTKTSMVSRLFAWMSQKAKSRQSA